jgi:hypothetical protein
VIEPQSPWGKKKYPACSYEKVGERRKKEFSLCFVTLPVLHAVGEGMKGSPKNAKPEGDQGKIKGNKRVQANGGIAPCAISINNQSTQ